jgi:hypothetical protein
MKLLVAVIFLVVMLPQIASACITCVTEGLWSIMPYYPAWIWTFVVWGLIVLGMSFYFRNSRAKTLLRAALIVGVLIISVAFHPIFPIALVVLFVLWARSYFRTYRRLQTKTCLPDDRAFLILNHLTLACLVILAIYFQTNYIVGGLPYRLKYISASGAKADRERIVRGNLMTHGEIVAMLKGKSRHGKENAAMLLVERNDADALDLIMDELIAMNSRSVPWGVCNALYKLTGRDPLDYSRESWVTWYQSRQSPKNLKAEGSNIEKGTEPPK